MEQEFDELMQASEIPAAPAAVEKAEEYDGKGIALVTGAHAMHDTYSGFLPALLPLLIEKFSLTNTLAGVLSLVYTIPAVLQPVIGFLADRVNLRVLIVFAPAITGLIMTSVGIVPSYSLLVVLLLFAGLSSSSLHSVGPGVGSHFSGRRIGRGMSFWMIGGEFGYSFGPLLATTAVGIIGLTRLPLLAIGGVLISLMLWFAMRDVDTRSVKREQSVDKAAFLSGLRKVMLPMVLLLVTRGLMAVMLSTFLPTFLRWQGASLGFAGAGMAIAGAAGVVGSYLAGNLSDSFGRRRTLLISILATPVMMLLFLHTRGWVQVVFLMFSGFFGLALLPVMIATIMEYFKETRSFANGIYMALNFIITALAGVLAGRLADVYGWTVTFTIASVMVFMGVFALLLMPRDGSSAKTSAE